MPEAVALAVVASLPDLGGAVATSGAFAGYAAGSVAAAQAIGYVAVGAGVLGASLAAQALMGRPQSTSTSPAASQINVRQGLSPRERSYGRVKVGGAIAFEKVRDHGLGPDFNLAGVDHILILQGQGEIDAVEEHWFENIQGASLVSGVPELWLGGNAAAPNVVIENLLGTADQEAFSLLVSLFGAFYTAQHRWRGVPITRVSFATGHDTPSTLAIYPQGPWKYRCVQRAALLYDPRDDTQTANGDPDRPRDSNWAWSDSASLVILDFLRHPDGWARRADRAMLPIAMFRAADWIAFANVCDETVNLRVAGTRKRYRLCGSYDMTQPPKSILQGLLDGCDAELYRHGDGTIGIRGGAWTPAPAGGYVTITDADILSHSLRAGQKKASACNIVNAKYVSPPHDYQSVDMDPWLDQDNIDLRGEELKVDIDLAWCPSHAQARAISKIQIAKRNPEWSGTIVTGPRGLLAFNERIIVVQVPELDINETFLITSFRPSPTFEKVEIGVASLDSTAYDFDPDTEEGTAQGYTALDDPVENVPYPINIAVTEVILAGGIPQASVSWTAVNPGNLAVNWECQAIPISPAGADPTLLRVSENALNALSASVNTDTETTLAAGTTYQFQVRGVSPGGQPSGWQFPAPAMPTGLSISSVPGTDPDTGDPITIVTFGWTNPSNTAFATFDHAHVYRGTSTFAAATSLGIVSGTAGAASNTTDVPGAGSWKYWVTAEDAINDASLPAGPSTITI